MVKHVYCDPYLPDEDPSYKKVLRFLDIEFVDSGVILFGNINDQSSIKFAQLQRLKCWKKMILHSYHLKLLQIRGQIFSTLEGMIQGKKRTRTRRKVGSTRIRKIYTNRDGLSTASGRPNCLEAQRRNTSHGRRRVRNRTRFPILVSG